jgi:DNA-binding beta-propeller fold protein YncE
MKNWIIFVWIFFLTSFVFSETQDCKICPSLGLPGNLWVTNKRGNSVSVISLKTGKHLITFPMPRGPHELSLSDNGKFVATANYANRPAYVTLLNPKDFTFKKFIRLNDFVAVHGLKFIDDERLIITDEERKKILILNVLTEKIEKVVDTSPFSCHLVIVDKKKRIAYGTDRIMGKIVVIDYESGKLVTSKPSGKGSEGIDKLKDEIWVANRDDNTITIFDESLNIKKILNCSSFPIRVAFSDSSFQNVLIPNGVSGDVAIFDSVSHKELSRVSLRKPGKPNPFPCGILNIKEFAFISNCEENSITIISLKSRRIVGEIKGNFLNENDGMVYTTDN